MSDWPKTTEGIRAQLQSIAGCEGLAWAKARGRVRLHLEGNIRTARLDQAADPGDADAALFEELSREALARLDDVWND